MQCPTKNMQALFEIPKYPMSKYLFFFAIHDDTNIGKVQKYSKD